MRLTDEQVRAFRRRETPHLEWDEPFDCPATFVIETRRSAGIRGDGSKFTVENHDLSVTVVNLKRKLIKGEGAVYQPTEIRVVDLRPETLLRKSLPAARATKGTDHSVKPPTEASIEAARVDGAYTDTPALALTGPGASDPGEGNPVDWKDSERGARELGRQEARRQERAERDARETSRLVRERVTHIFMEAFRNGNDISSAVTAIYALLDEASQETQKRAA